MEQKCQNFFDSCDNIQPPIFCVFGKLKWELCIMFSRSLSLSLFEWKSIAYTFDFVMSVDGICFASILVLCRCTLNDTHKSSGDFVVSVTLVLFLSSSVHREIFSSRLSPRANNLHFILANHALCSSYFLPGTFITWRMTSEASILKEKKEQTSNKTKEETTEREKKQQHIL